MIYFFLIVWFSYWSAEAGASLPWSKLWQDKIKNGHRIPEIIIALTIALTSLWGIDKIFNLHIFLELLLFVLAFLISLAGKESATWAYLTWKSHAPVTPDRKSTLRPLNDFIAKFFGYKLGDEGYAWIWAAVKGFIITLPVGGLGIIFHPLGHEIGSHAKGRLGGDSNMWKEITSGAGIAVAVAVFVIFIKTWG